MALEEAVNRLALAIEKHTELLVEQMNPRALPVPRETPAPDASAPVDITPKKGPGRPPKVEPAPATDAKTIAGAQYEELRQAVLKVAEVKGHKTAIAILADFGVTHAKQITEDKFAEALAAFKDALSPQALA
jgi:hypothetical protein